VAEAGADLKKKCNIDFKMINEFSKLLSRMMAPVSDL